jgi:hypothetical protein
MPWELLTVLKSFSIFSINYLSEKFIATNFGYSVFTYFFFFWKVSHQADHRLELFDTKKNCKIQQSNKRLNSVLQNPSKSVVAVFLNAVHFS